MLSGNFRKSVAFIFDFILIGSIYAFATGQFMLGESGRYGFYLTGVPAVLLALIIVLYFIISEAKFQRTLGAKFSGIIITNLEGGKPTLKQVLIRNLGRILDILWIPLFFSVFSPMKQRVSDFFAQTLVLKKYEVKEDNRIEVRNWTNARKISFSILAILLSLFIGNILFTQIKTLSEAGHRLETTMNLIQNKDFETLYQNSSKILKDTATQESFVTSFENNPTIKNALLEAEHIELVRAYSVQQPNGYFDRIDFFATTKQGVKSSNILLFSEDGLAALDVVIIEAPEEIMNIVQPNNQ